MDISEGNKLKVYPPKLRIKATIAPIINDPKRNPRQYRNSSLFQSRFRESSLGSSDVDYYNQNIQAPITTIAIDTPVTLLKYMGGNLLNFNFFIVIFFYRGAPLPLILSITLSFQEMFELGIDIEECDIETIQEVIE